MRRVTDLLDLAAVGLGVGSAYLAAGSWAALAAGSAGCAVLSWATERRR